MPRVTIGLELAITWPIGQFLGHGLLRPRRPWRVWGGDARGCLLPLLGADPPPGLTVVITRSALTDSGATHVQVDTHRHRAVLSDTPHKAVGDHWFASDIDDDDLVHI
jgi:hypothetical protein